MTALLRLMNAQNGARSATARIIFLSRTAARIVPFALLAAAMMTTIDESAAARFAGLALDCVDREYPNKIAHVMNSDKDAKPPRELTPAFYGCFDWHSSVHGHWLLARLARMFPDAPFTKRARDVLRRHLTPDKMAAEAEYVRGDGRATFERPYGLAWLLQLGQELREWDDPHAREWAANLRPLEAAVRDRLSTWLPKLSYPERTGVHSQTAFALGLMYDSSAQEPEFRALVSRKIRDFYLNDVRCPVTYEPSGQDFLSPCIAEADAVRRVLPGPEFAAWLDTFLPTIPLQPEKVTDPTDGQLAHLDGLNLSRAWMLEGIAAALPADNKRKASIADLARRHREAGLASVTGEHYEGGHWLGSFAVYLVTGRGLPNGAKLP